MDLTSRPDGFVHVWDFPDDPHEPCWNQAAIEAVQYVARLLGLDPELDFKIECQTVDYREEMAPGTFMGVNHILIHGDKYLYCDNTSLTIRDIGFITDGFMGGWFSAHSVPTRRASEIPPPPLFTDVHTEHCCFDHGCKYGNEDCTVTAKLARQSYPCESCDDKVC